MNTHPKNAPVGKPEVDLDRLARLIENELRRLRAQKRQASRQEAATTPKSDT